MGVFTRMMKGLSIQKAEPQTVMIEAAYLKAHPTASSLGAKKGDLGRLIGRTKGGMSTKLHAITDANGRPLSFVITAGQIGDYTGVAASLDNLPKAKWMIADRGYDADRSRNALEQRGIKPCIPGRKSRSLPANYDKRRYKRRNRIEIIFGRLKDGAEWQRDMTATRPPNSPPSLFPPPCSSGCDQ